MVAFAAGVLFGALLIRNVGVVAALSFALAIIIIVALIAAHRVSRVSSDWSAPRPA